MVLQKWCYADNSRRTTTNTFSEPEVEITYSIDHSEDGQEGNEVVRENHGTLQNASYYNASAATYGNNDVPSLAQDGAFQTTETSQLITSGQGKLIAMYQYEILNHLNGISIYY